MSVVESALDRSELIERLQTLEAEKETSGSQHVVAIVAAAETEAQAKLAWEAAAQNHRQAVRDKRDALDPLDRKATELRRLLDDALPSEIHELIDRIDKAIAATEATTLPTREVTVHKGDFALPTKLPLADAKDVARVRGRVKHLRTLRKRVLTLTYKVEFSDALVECEKTFAVQPKTKRRFLRW